MRSIGIGLLFFGLIFSPVNAELDVLDFGLNRRANNNARPAKVQPSKKLQTSEVKRVKINMNYKGNLVRGRGTGSTTGSGPAGLQVLSLNFKNVQSNDTEVIQSITNLTELEADDLLDNLPPEIIGEPLAYPNPFKLVGDGTEIGYRLNKNMDIEIHVYDMQASRIFHGEYSAGSEGARVGYNRLQMNVDTMDGFELSAGVYFFVIVNDGKVLGRGKMGVIP